MNIIGHISSLLFHHECVIIPDFGGFVTQFCNTRIHYTQHIFSPPTRSVAFNKNLVNNDGLLINYIAAQEKISYSKSTEFVNKFVADCRYKLSTFNKLELSKLGIFHYDDEKNLQFDPDPNTNYLLDTFGLSHIQSSPVSRQTVNKTVKQLSQNRPSLPLLKIKRVRIKKMLYFIIPLALIVFGVGLQLKYKDLLNFNYSQLFPFVETNLKSGNSLVSGENYPNLSKTPVIDSDTFNIDNSLSGSQPDLSNKQIEKGTSIEESVEKITPTKVPVTVNTPEPVVPSTEKFHIIGGAFQNYMNAEKLIKRLIKKGYDAKLAGQTKGGLYRVSYDSFDTKKEATSALKNIKINDNNDAWLLVNSI